MQPGDWNRSHPEEEWRGCPETGEPGGARSAQTAGQSSGIQTLQVKHCDGCPAGPGEIGSILYTFAQFLLF